MGNIKWLGQSGFKIKSEEESILIDPFLTDNPEAPIEAEEIEDVDVVCITHDHMDHLGDSIKICKDNGATFVGIFELGSYAVSEEVEEVIEMNIGATEEVKGIDISMVKAFHSSDRGVPTGFVLGLDEKRIYHAGDTSIFGDMELISELYDPEIACLPIGDYYTMGAREATKAVELIEPEIIIPMHYKTFPVLDQSSDKFLEELKKADTEAEAIDLDPGEVYEFSKS